MNIKLHKKEPMSPTEWVVRRIRWKLEELGMTEQDLECLAVEIACDAVTYYEEQEVHDAINALVN